MRKGRHSRVGRDGLLGGWSQVPQSIDGGHFGHQFENGGTLELGRNGWQVLQSISLTQQALACSYVGASVHKMQAKSRMDLWSEPLSF